MYPSGRKCKVHLCIDINIEAYFIFTSRVVEIACGAVHQANIDRQGHVGRQKSTLSLLLVLARYSYSCKRVHIMNNTKKQVV